MTDVMTIVRKRLVRQAIWALIVSLLVHLIDPLMFTAHAHMTEATDSERVSMDFKSAPLNEVLAALADLAGLNLLIDESVSGAVTMTLRDQSVTDAIGLISRTHGFDVERVGDTLIVASPDRFRQGIIPKQLDSFRIKHVDPLKAADLVMQLYPDISLVLDESTGFIAMTGSERSLAGALQFLSQYDEEKPLQFIRTPVQEVLMAISSRAGLHLVMEGTLTGEVTAFVEGMDYSEAIRLVTEATGLSYELEGQALYVRKAPDASLSDFATTPTRRILRVDYVNPETAIDMVQRIWPGLGVTADIASRLIVLDGMSQDMTEAEAFIRDIDVRPGQVYVEARVEEISVDAMRQLGLSWQSSGFNWSGDQPATAVLPWNPSQLYATLEILDQEGKADLLASPRLAAVDGEEARILIGDRIPLIMTRKNADGELSEELEYIEAGIALEITPIVGQDGFITLDIRTEVSSITGLTTQGVPELRTREAVTRIRVKDGQPLAIGGLIQEEERVSMSGLPFLKDIPLLGRLFQNEKTDLVRSETVIFLTPRIVRDDMEIEPFVPETAEPMAPVNNEPIEGRSVSIDVGRLADRSLYAEYESPVDSNHFTARLYLSGIDASPPNWGLGVGIRRYFDAFGSPWVDVGIDRIQSQSDEATFMYSARVGGRGYITDRMFAEPYLEYRLIPSRPTPGWFVPALKEGISGGLRFGWRY